MCLSLVIQSSDKKWAQRWAHHRRAHMQRYTTLTMKSQRSSAKMNGISHLLQKIYWWWQWPLERPWRSWCMESFQSRRRRFWQPTMGGRRKKPRGELLRPDNHNQRQQQNRNTYLSEANESLLISPPCISPSPGCVERHDIRLHASILFAKQPPLRLSQDDTSSPWSISSPWAQTSTVEWYDGRSSTKD